MNSKYNTKEKILDFVNGKVGWFANTTEKAPFLHELGHKYYEDCVKSLAKQEIYRMMKQRKILIKSSITIFKITWSMKKN